jgi:hypothetical protein
VSRHARILAEYAAEVVERYRQSRRLTCSHPESRTILTIHPSGGWLVECDECHYRWLEQGEELDRTTEAINQ